MEKAKACEILGVSINATRQQIGSAFKKKSKQYHPDKKSDDYSARQWEQLLQAYTTLSTPEQQAAEFPLAIEYKPNNLDNSARQHDFPVQFWVMALLLGQNTFQSVPPQTLLQWGRDLAQEQAILAIEYKPENLYIPTSPFSHLWIRFAAMLYYQAFNRIAFGGVSLADDEIQDDDKHFWRSMLYGQNRGVDQLHRMGLMMSLINTMSLYSEIAFSTSLINNMPPLVFPHLHENNDDTPPEPSPNFSELSPNDNIYREAEALGYSVVPDLKIICPVLRQIFTSPARLSNLDEGGVRTMNTQVDAIEFKALELCTDRRHPLTREVFSLEDLIIDEGLADEAKQFAEEAAAWTLEQKSRALLYDGLQSLVRAVTESELFIVIVDFLKTLDLALERYTMTASRMPPLLGITYAFFLGAQSERSPEEKSEYSIHTRAAQSIEAKGEDSIHTGATRSAEAKVEGSIHTNAPSIINDSNTGRVSGLYNLFNRTRPNTYWEIFLNAIGCNTCPGM